MDKTRKNTLKIVFANQEKVPQFLDVLRFSKSVLKLPATDVHSIYRDENDHCFYLKFNDEPTFAEFTGRLEEKYPFSHNGERTSFVSLEVASRLFRYVRIFNLPPEVDEKEIATVLSKYGTIRQHVRERYPASCGYAVYNGVRGVHMEIDKELPSNLHISHYKARLYYEGLKNKCFFCKQEGHVKVNCPKATQQKALEDQVNSGSSSGGSGSSYSNIVAGTSVPSTSASGINMKNLAGAIANNRTISPQSKPNLTILSGSHDWPARLNDIRDVSPISPIRRENKTSDNRTPGQAEKDEPLAMTQREGDNTMDTEATTTQPEMTSTATNLSNTEPIADRPSRSVTRKSTSLLADLDNRSRSRSYSKGNWKDGKDGKGKQEGGKGKQEGRKGKD